MSTFSATPSDIQRKWYIIDATDLVLGRAASQVATLLRGKHKPYYTPSIDCGDNVIVINAEKIHVTGRKYENKKYYWHTGFPGGIKERTLRKKIEGNQPENVFEKAVERMISRNPLGRKQLTKLHVYAGSDHPHAGQNPEPYTLADKNDKNSKRF